MWKIISTLQRASLGSARASLREDHQRTGHGFSLLHKSGVKSLSSLPHLSLIPPSEGVATAAVGQSLGKEIGSPPASSKPAINHNTFYQHDKGQNEAPDNWSFLEAFQLSATLALSYSLLRDKKGLRSPVPECCRPIRALEVSKSAQAQSLHDDDEQTKLITPIDLSANLEQQFDLNKDASADQDVQLKHHTHESSSSALLTTPQGQDSSRQPGDGAKKKQPDGKQLLSPAEEFKLEVESLRAVQLLEAGNIQGISLLKTQSRLGSSVASFYLGMAFEQGFLVNKNLRKARIYYEKSAAAENPEAQYNLAVFYLEGMGGLTKDAAKGRGLLEKAAAGGVAAALEALGVDQVKEESCVGEKSGEELYSLGRSFQDLGEIKTALEFYTQAAEAGCSKALRAKERLTSVGPP